MKNALRKRVMGGALVLAAAVLANTRPVLAQDYGYAGDINSLVSRIALYPDPLLAQIFAAAAFPDQIAAAAQGSGGAFDPSVEALMQYPSVLQMMASDPGWTQALSNAVMQNEGAVMDTIQNLRREAQQYGYLQSGPQMQVVDDGGYIDIEPVGGFLYVPVYDPYVVFARPQPGFFVGGAIRFGTGFHWTAGYNSFNWRSHQVVVNRRVWTPPVNRRPVPAPPAFDQRRFADNRQNFANGNPGWNRNNATPAPPPAQRNFAPAQPQRDLGRPTVQRNFVAPQQQPQQRSFSQPSGNVGRQMPQQTPPRQMEQHNFAPQGRNAGARIDRGGEGRGR